MADKLKTFNSFADIPRDAVVTVLPTPPEPKHWINWDPGAMAVQIIGAATETLQTWMIARMSELNRDKVAMEDISIVHKGGRTVIRVLGKDRYEFKVKCTMGAL